MSVTLHIYETEKLEELVERYNEFKIVTISYCINEFPNVDDLDYLSESHYIAENSIIDISVLFHASNNPLFIERYILNLIDNKNDILFIMNSKYLPVIKEITPHLFDSYNFDFISEKNNDKFNPFSSLTLNVYHNQEDVQKEGRRKNLTLLSQFISSDNSLIMKFDYQKIEKMSIDFKGGLIDLTSAVKNIINKEDHILFFESFIYQVASLGNIEFCIEEYMKEDLLKASPFLFSDIIEHVSNDISRETVLEDKEINVMKLQGNLDKIGNLLIGHDEFKKALQSNLKKFTVLNQLGSRKIFSILISGNSGIGKTEFAKIFSNVFYPNEQLIKINFGNYSTEGVLNSLIGSPKGYIGSEDGGELIDKLLKTNSKVILIDEFEKANKAVLNFFYELLEDGKFTDRQGIEHDLNGYIIIFTSNMTELDYKEYIPDALKSRFDMVYKFNNLDTEGKMNYIKATKDSLIRKLEGFYNVHINSNDNDERFLPLVNQVNLREIKRMVEDIVIADFFEVY